LVTSPTARPAVCKKPGPCAVRAGCNDGTGHRTDGCRCAGIIRGVVPRTVSCGPWVIVDLADLACIDRGSLGVLVGARERAQLAGGDVLLAGPRGAVAQLLLTGRAGEFSVFPSVGVAAFSAGLAAIGTRLAADGAREPLAT